MDVVTVLQEIASGLREGNEKVKHAVAIRTARVALAEYKRPKIKEYTLGKPEFDAIHKCAKTQPLYVAHLRKLGCREASARASVG